MDRQISNKIKQAMEEKGMTYRALEERTGISRSTLQRYIEKEDSKVSLDSIEKIAMALHTEPSYLMGWTDTLSTIDMEKYGLRPIKKIKLPLLGNISCGEPKYADEDRESYIETGTNVNADFCLRANGDSMINARINDGDIVFIRSMPQVENGQIAAVIIDDEATLKRVYYYPENNMMILKPENSKYKDLIYIGQQLEDVHILGLAVAFQSDVI